MSKIIIITTLLVVLAVAVGAVESVPTTEDDSDMFFVQKRGATSDLHQSQYTEKLAREWLKNLSEVYLPAMPIMTKVSWLIETKMADDSDEWKIFDEVEAAELAISDFRTEAESLVKDLVQLRWLGLTGQFTDDAKKKLKKMRELSRFKWREFKDEQLKRSFHRAIILMGDSGIQDIDRIYKLKEIKNTMIKTFSTAKVRINNTLVPLDPNIVTIFEKSRDYDQLAQVWSKWRDASGKKYERDYPNYVKLSNEATSEYGFKDYGDYSRSSFEVTDLNKNFDDVYKEIEKLYKLLHAYTKRELLKIYPNELDANKSVLPAHLLGDMWAQQWHNLFEDIKPYKNKLLLDITPKMKAKNMTINEMVKVAEEFFMSLGMEPLPQKFWDHSIFEKPKDNREINCHASAWDFLNGEDYRIKMCSEVTMNDLFIMHHEMGHIYYYMHYKNQPFQFKEGANPGFHEAIGDLMTLSVMTPSHLHKIGLLDKFVEDDEQDINFLMFSALRNIAFAPFALAVEKWRWNAYSGNSTPETYNIDWWRLRCKYQGLVPPVPRADDDFDPGSKYHIAASVPYDRYFVSLVLTFQFHEALCRESGHSGPLHKCDIYQSKEAGKKLSEMMSKGISEPWPDILSDLTDGRQNSLDPSSILEYFRPLNDWLLKQNLTETEWDCESFIDPERFTVKSYDGSTGDFKSSAASAVVSATCLSFIHFICFCRFMQYL